MKASEYLVAEWQTERQGAGWCVTEKLGGSSIKVHGPMPAADVKGFIAERRKIVSQIVAGVIHGMDPKRATGT